MKRPDRRSEEQGRTLSQNHDDVGANSKDSDIERIWEVPEGALDPDKEIHLSYDGLPLQQPGVRVTVTKRQWKKSRRFLVIFCVIFSIAMLAAALASPPEHRVCLVFALIASIVVGLGITRMQYEWGRIGAGDGS